MKQCMERLQEKEFLEDVRRGCQFTEVFAKPLPPSPAYNVPAVLKLLQNPSRVFSELTISLR